MTLLAVALFLVSRGAGAALSIQGRASFALLTAAGTFLVGLGALGLIHLVSPESSEPTLPLVRRVGVESSAHRGGGALRPLGHAQARRALHP